MAKHNKKRNTGLLYEWLARYIANAIVEENEEKRVKAFNIIKKHFKKGTELYREFRLFNALVSTSVSNESVADNILEEARFAARDYDQDQLDREKSLLIRDINHNLNDPNFYLQKVEEYTDYATIQTLLNEWRKEEDYDIAKTAKYEDRLRDRLVSDKPKENLTEHVSDESDALVVKLMTKKINEKYGNLGENAQKLIKAYVFEEDEEKVKKYIGELKESALENLNSYLLKESNNNKYIKNKLEKVKELIEKTPIDQVNDETVGKFLDVAKLKEEI